MVLYLLSVKLNAVLQKRVRYVNSLPVCTSALYLVQFIVHRVCYVGCLPALTSSLLYTVYVML